MMERPAAHSFGPSASTAFADTAGSGYEGRPSQPEDDFEFTFPIGGARDEPIVTADELFSHGRILPVYPVFNRSLALNSSEESAAKPPARQIPIRRILVEESGSRSGSISSSSSSEADDLVSTAAREYRPRTVRSAPQSPEWRRECTSTETSRRWKLWDTLFSRRSHSDGKKKSMFLEFPSSPPLERSPRQSKGPNPKPGVNGKAAKGPRRSFLPFRSELFGFFDGWNRRPFY
ncbi:uncharacterized protein LOC122032463 [Zingiber officinale]|uniref:Uncharacterized protein n=1 Tax=Zingiber officinale TaxID=94328 RepID=A0A8J5C8N1_ZINOF|nr:uncharacterized protein LOC122032463 [Zingiber officinale]KAG6470634.1 hypothetical protein ZIOFF_071711 [Zingiber officinale]